MQSGIALQFPRGVITDTSEPLWIHLGLGDIKLTVNGVSGLIGFFLLGSCVAGLALGINTRGGS